MRVLAINELLAGCGDANPLAAAEISEVRSCVLDAINSLPPEMAELIESKYGLGREQATARELAIQFEKSEVTIRRIWRQAEGILAVLLEDLRPRWTS